MENVLPGHFTKTENAKSEKWWTPPLCDRLYFHLLTGSWPVRNAPPSINLLDVEKLDASGGGGGGLNEGQFVDGARKQGMFHWNIHCPRHGTVNCNCRKQRFSFKHQWIALFTNKTCCTVEVAAMCLPWMGSFKLTTLVILNRTVILYIDQYRYDMVLFGCTLGRLFI